MSRVARSALGLLALLVLPGTAQAQALPSATPIDAWGPSGTVNAIARAGDTLYVGGDFDYVGSATGPFVVLDSATGESLPVPGVTGRVDRVASVPGGGWILAGAITLAGQASPNRQLVRVDASGGVIPSWFATFSGSLGFLAADTSAVYLGGFIHQVNGTVREGIAAVDLATGALLPWDPVLDNGQPTASVDEGLLYQGALFLRGSFSSVGGQPAAGFAALDAPTAALRPSSTAPVSQVRAMSATGGTLYVTGYDNSLVWAGASMAIATGVATRWNVPSGFYIDELEATSLRVFARSAAGVVALDPVTGAQIGPPFSAAGFVTGMAVAGDNLVLAGQVFAATVSYQVLATPQATLGPPVWTRVASGPIDSIAVSGAQAAVGGAFDSVGGVSRSKLFALDLRTGRPTSFAPTGLGSVTALTVVGNVLVVGGFAQISGRSATAFALDLATAQPLPWAPVQFGSVDALATDGQNLYLGGRFDLVDRVSRPRLASISLATGGVTNWLPVPDGDITALSYADGALLVGGGFTALAAGARGGGAAFPGGGSALAPWNPEAGFGVRAVDAAAGRIGLGGTFSQIHGRNVQGFAVFDPAGTLLPFSAPARLQSIYTVRGLGAQFLIGGATYSQAESPVAIVSALTGADLGWAPLFEGPAYSVGITTSARYPDFAVIAGRFASAGGRPALNLAIFPSAGAAPPSHLRVRVTGNTVSLGWDPPAGTTPQAYVLEVASLGSFPLVANSVAGAVGPGSYTVRVRAVVDGVPGAASTPITFSVPADPVVPPVPVALAGFVSGGVVRISWAPGLGPGNVESYVIEAGNFPGLANFGAVDTGVVDLELTAAVPPGTYYVRVRAKNAFGVSGASNEVLLVVP